MINYFFANLFLLIWTISDVKTKSISRFCFIVCALLAIVISISEFLMGTKSPAGIAFGLAVGALMYGLAVLTGEKIGKGDAVAVGICGILLGGINAMLALFYGLVIAAVAGILLLALKKIKPKQTLPFIPFLFMGNLICTLSEVKLF